MGVSQAQTNLPPRTKTVGRFSVEAAVQKPKERQFQVVPVPCVFTRGRWKCWDFKLGTEVPGVTPDILEFAEKTPSGERSQPAAVETPSTVRTTSMTNISNTAGVTFTHTITPSDVTASAEQRSERVTTPMTPNPKESSTIVVTSIEPAPVTPVHSTRDASYGSDYVDGTDGSNRGATSPTKHTVLQPNYAFHNADARDSSSADSGRASHNGARNYSPPPNNVSPPPQQCKNANPASLSRQASVNGFAHPSDPNDIPSEESGASSQAAPNMGAIDNKIEQAMDLVKTHLTFAVREEVEVLRSHIVDLEAKVSDLERQNQFLRQFVPADVIANIPMLMTQQRLPSSGAPQLPTAAGVQQVPNRSTTTVAPQAASSSSGGSPKGNEQQTAPSMIPKLNRPSGIPLPNSFFDSSGAQVRRSPEP
uniref:TSC22 domain family protein 1-like n=1 Tax=Steinernema glaseri TaxID=37863 RepID=A0A1I7Z469_9BILA